MSKGLGFQIFTNLCKFNFEKPSEKCLIVNDKEFLTFKQVLWKTIQLAQAFARAGHKPNEIFAICSENNAEFVLLAIACLYLGIIVCPINCSYSEGRIQYILEKTKPTAIFASKLLRKKIFNANEALLQNTSEIFTITNEESSELSEFVKKQNGNFMEINIYGFKPLEIDRKNQILSILFSSGSLGFPKCVFLNQEDTLFQINSQIYKSKQSVECNILLPLFHPLGFILLLENLIKGRTSVINQSCEICKISSDDQSLPLLLSFAESPLITRLKLKSFDNMETGDIAYIDENGYFYIFNNSKQLFKYKSVEISAALLVTYPRINEVAILAIPFASNHVFLSGFVLKQHNFPFFKHIIHQFIKDRVQIFGKSNGGLKYYALIPSFKDAQKGYLKLSSKY